MAPSVSSISIAVIAPSAVTVRVEAPDAFLLAVGNAGEGEHGRWARASRARLVDLFFKLGVAEEKAQRGAQIVELFGCDALYLGIALGIEPRVFAVEQEELSGGRGVVPAHAAGLEQQRVPLSVRCAQPRSSR